MLEITVRISVESEAGLTDLDRAVLSALSPGSANLTVTTTPAKAAPAKAAPAKAAEPAPAATTEPPADDEAKMEEAVGRATSLINEGNADKLRSVLGTIGVKRVSELEGEQLDAFLAATAS